MINVLSDAGIAALRSFASAGPLLGLDYDGTLAPICDDRDNAHLSDHTRYLLQVVALCYSTVVISGRARRDLQRLLGNVPGVECIGNHGAEMASDTSVRTDGLVRAWGAHLNERLGHIPGLVIEDKQFSLSVHYRSCQPWTAARSVVLDAVHELEGARVLGGKAVINVVPISAPHKGEALLRACAQKDKSHAIYVGDDETDEDVFRMHDTGRIFTIQVGHRAGSSAQYLLRDQGQLDKMLGFLIHCRRDGIQLKEHPHGWGWSH
jgi:trehalose 6-phosphate phosphatase